jgi:hypothetical protein
MNPEGSLGMPLEGGGRHTAAAGPMYGLMREQAECMGGARWQCLCPHPAEAQAFSRERGAQLCSVTLWGLSMLWQGLW